jgi:hypothetical protein
VRYPETTFERPRRSMTPSFVNATVTATGRPPS